MKRLMLAGLLVGLFAGTATAETTLRFSLWVPPTHPVAQRVILPWGENIAKATEGRVKVDFISALGAPPAHFDLVKNGVADAGFAVHSYTAARFQLTRAAELPFLADDSESASVAYWRLHERFFAKANEHEGVHLSVLFVHGPANLYTVSKEIKSLSDLAGLKMRVAGGITADVGKAFDTVPFQAPATQAYEALSKGVADGIFFPAESVPSFKLETIIRHGLNVPGGLYRSSMYFIINSAKWAGLSDADKAAINSVSGEAHAHIAGQGWDYQDRWGNETMEKAGVGLRTASGPLLDEIRQRLGYLEGEWLEAAEKRGVDGKAALTFYREEIAKAKTN